jgi:hypothetical protein
MDFLAAIYCRSWRAAWVSLNGTSTYEMLRLLDQIDRLDLADFLDTKSTQSAGTGADRIVFAASVVLNARVPASLPASISASDRNEANSFITNRSPLQIPSDPTRMLPVSGANIPLTAADFQSGADELGVEVAAVRAVATVESGTGRGFSADGRAIIRYELHRFHKYTAGAYDRTHPHLSKVYPGGLTHVGGQPTEWSTLYGAMILRNRLSAAIMSASWGVFQIMGENYTLCGYPTALAFANDMCRSTLGQLTVFLKFCRGKNIVRYLAAKDWAGFAYHYNGADYARNNYDTKMAAAYRRFSSAP